MKTALICVMGNTPSVVSEAWYLHRHEVTDLVVLYPSGEEFHKSFELLLHGINIKSAEEKINVRTHGVKMPLGDVSSEMELITFVEFFSEVIREERSVHRVQRILTLISGGRKSISAIIPMIAPILHIDEVIHVSATNFIRQSATSTGISQRFDVPDDLLMDILFPDISTYKEMVFPVIPYPKKYIEELYSVLSKKSNNSAMEDLLVTTGYLQKSGGQTILTSKGALVLKILKPLVESYL